MHTFNPQPGTQISIGETPYEFISHYFFPKDSPGVYLIEGQEAFIWPLHNLKDRTFWALKVLKPGYRSGRIARVTATLRDYIKISGFFLSRRICLTRPEYDRLIAMFPDLEYAILMPWLPWKTWAILLTEMLTWWNPLIRGLTSPSASTLFQPEELQQSSGPRWQMVRDLFWSLDKTGALLDLFDTTWHSANPQLCPDFATWIAVLQQIAPDNSLSPLPSPSPYLRLGYTEQDA